MKRYKYRKKNNYSKVDTGYVYLLKLYIPINSKVTVSVYKVGFTSRDYIERVKEYKMKNEIIAVFESSQYECYRLEQFIHKNYKPHRYIFDRDIKFSGKTECYICIVGVSLLTSKLKRVI